MEGNLCDRSKNRPEDGRVINRERQITNKRGVAVAKIQMKRKNVKNVKRRRAAAGAADISWRLGRKLLMFCPAVCCNPPTALFDKLPIKKEN